VEKGTQDFMNPIKFLAFWVMYVSCYAILCCVCFCEFVDLPVISVDIISGMEVVDRE